MASGQPPDSLTTRGGLSMNGVEVLVGLAEKLGIIQKVKDKLINRPDPAATKLVVSLEEISKIFSATESELSRYLSVYFTPGESNDEERNALLSLESGALNIRWNEARGHCHKIMNIYDKYLGKWFSRVLSPEENIEMQDLFFQFREVEGGFLENLNSVTNWLAPEAKAVLDLAISGNIGDANTRVLNGRKYLLPFRQKMVRAMAEMLDLQTEFIQITGTV